MVCEYHFRQKPSVCFCKHPEQIENYDKAISDKDNMWECHHRMEAIYTRAELKQYGLYYNCEPHQLIFLTKQEHMKWPHAGRKAKKSYYQSKEYKDKMSKVIREKTINKGKHWYNNGIVSIMAFECPEGFIPGSLHRSNSTKGQHWKLIDGKRCYY